MIFKCKNITSRRQAKHRVGNSLGVAKKTTFGHLKATPRGKLTPGKLTMEVTVATPKIEK